MLEFDLKRMLYRLRYRGIKELDIFFNKAARGLSILTEVETSSLINLMSESEDQIYVWVLGHFDRPKKYQRIIEKILTLT